MTYLKIFAAALLSVSFPTEAFAEAAYSMGKWRMFSRANCFDVNESITWSPLQYLDEAYLETWSDQHHTSGAIVTFNDFTYGFRSRAGCFFCSDGGGWMVMGHHFIRGSTDTAIHLNCKGDYTPCRISQAYDCMIGEGWF